MIMQVVIHKKGLRWKCLSKFFLSYLNYLKVFFVFRKEKKKNESYVKEGKKWKIEGVCLVIITGRNSYL